MEKYSVYKLTSVSTGITVVMNLTDDDDAIVVDMLDIDPSELADMVMGLDQTVAIAALETENGSINGRYSFVPVLKTIPVRKMLANYEVNLGILTKESQDALVNTILGIMGLSGKTAWDTEKKMAFVSDVEKHGIDYVVDKYHIRKATAYKYNKRFRNELRESESGGV